MPKAVSHKIQIVIVDDHDLIIKGFTALMDAHPIFSILSAFSSSEVAAKQLNDLNYDILISDIKLHGKNGFSLCALSKQLYPSRKVVLFSGYNESIIQAEVKKSNADGFFSKQFELEEILPFLTRIINDEKVFLFDEIDDPLKLGKDFLEPVFETYLSQLSKKEKKVISCYAKNMKDVEIAEKLGLSKSTILTFKKRIYKKLEINDMQSLMKVCWECGLM